ncbi:MAG: hypothetical protein AB1847_13475 [bacterium]
MHSDLILNEFKNLCKGVTLLRASADRFSPYDPEKPYTPDELEYYDSLSFRFEKSVELMLSFFKGLEIYTNSRSSDTLRDRLLWMQKIEIINNIEFWMEVRLLRNKISHVYLPEQMKDIYDEMINKSQAIFDTIGRIEKYLENAGINLA